MQGCQNSLGNTWHVIFVLHTKLYPFLWVRSATTHDSFAAKSRFTQCSPFHALHKAFLVILYLSSVLWLFISPLSLCPHTGLCNLETDLNTVSTVIVQLSTVPGPDHQSNVLTVCLVFRPRGWKLKLIFCLILQKQKEKEKVVCEINEKHSMEENKYNHSKTW